MRLTPSRTPWKRAIALLLPASLKPQLATATTAPPSWKPSSITGSASLNSSSRLSYIVSEIICFSSFRPLSSFSASSPAYGTYVAFGNDLQHSCLRTRQFHRSPRPRRGNLKSSRPPQARLMTAPVVHSAEDDIRAGWAPPTAQALEAPQSPIVLPLVAHYLFLLAMHVRVTAPGGATDGWSRFRLDLYWSRAIKARTDDRLHKSSALAGNVRRFAARVLLHGFSALPPMRSTLPSLAIARGSFPCPVAT